MRVILLLCLAMLAGSAAARDVYVKPHVRSDGTFVEGHFRSAPNSTKLDNFSTKGNINPYTIEPGKVDPFQIERPRKPRY